MFILNSNDRTFFFKCLHSRFGTQQRTRVWSLGPSSGLDPMWKSMEASPTFTSLTMGKYAHNLCIFTEQQVLKDEIPFSHKTKHVATFSETLFQAFVGFVKLIKLRAHLDLLFYAIGVPTVCQQVCKMNKFPWWMPIIVWKQPFPQLLVSGCL